MPPHRRVNLSVQHVHQQHASSRRLPCPCGRPLLAGFAALTLAALGAFAATKTGLDQPLVLTQVPVETTPQSLSTAPAGLVRADWFAGARLVVVAPDGQTRVLSEGFDSACDPNVSFDGQRVLFAARKARGDRWRIWEIGVDGKGLRPVTPDNLEARNAIHVSTLFTLDSPKPWFTTVFVGREISAAGVTSPWNLYNIKLEGGEVRQLTFNTGDNHDPFQTADSRLIYAAERIPQEPDEAGRRLGLFSIHIEGADNEFYGGERGARFQQMPCATEQGLVVFVESATPAADGSGQLACVEQRRPHVTYRPLTTDTAFRYLHPAPLRGNHLLVSRRPATGAGTCGIVRFDADTCRTEPVFDDPKFHDVQAVLLAPRRQPDGHSTVVTTADNYGALYGLNCYTTSPARAAGTKPGEVKRIRFLEGMAGAQPGTNDLVPRRLVGEAPVEADGSFNVELPADTPLLLQTVDERGLALGTCGWIWVKPRENRACIGCHEDPELVPENEYVQSLRRLPNRLLPAPEQRRSVTFLQDVVPILQKSCATAQCHGSTMSPLQLPIAAAAPSPDDLRKAYEALTVPTASIPHEAKAGPDSGKYVDAGRARTSRLAWVLLGENTTRAWDEASTRPAPASVKHRPINPSGERPQLSADEVKTVLLWIDLGAAFDAPTAAVTTPATPSK